MNRRQNPRGAAPSRGMNDERWNAKTVVRNVGAIHYRINRDRRRWPDKPILILPPLRCQIFEFPLAGLVLQWEESVRWNTRSWDCIEEYEHSVWFRIELQRTLDWYVVKVGMPSSTLLRRLYSIDRAFRRITFVANSSVTGLNLFRKGYFYGPRSKWWFLFRWPRQMTAQEREWYVDASAQSAFKES
jgi:hypothetical protein